MKKEYKAPYVEISVYAEDIICTSTIPRFIKGTDATAALGEKTYSDNFTYGG